MRKVILATHGELSKGMHNSLTMIIGDMANDIEVYCLYPGESPTDYAKKMKDRVQDEKETEFVFITDIKGGSIHTALMELCINENVKIFSGMNMNLILEVVLSCPDKINESSSEEIINIAKQGITFFNHESLSCESNEDF